MNVQRLLHVIPMPEGMCLRLRRYFMDREFYSDRRRAIKSGEKAIDFFENSDWWFEYQLLEEDETSFHSRRLLRRARELRISTPPVFNGNNLSTDFQRSGVDGSRYYLSLEGERKVRMAIREEEKYRSERWARRVPYITALAGLVGTITGLVALLAKWWA